MRFGKSELTVLVLAIVCMFVMTVMAPIPLATAARPGPHYYGVATLTYPANGATGIPTNPILTWTPPSDGLSNYYKIYVNPGSGAITYYSSTPSLALTLNPYSTYWWQVASSPDGGGIYGPLTATWSFTTGSNSAYYGVATLTYPANGATGIYTNPTLTWTGPSGANYYKIYVNPGSGATTYYSSTPSIALTLSPYTTYWWQVQASPDGGATYGPLCPTWSFTTGSGPWSGMATLTYPANGATGIYTNPTLTWTGPSGANYYKIYVNPGSGAITYYSSTPSLALTLNPYSTYWWQVASSPDGGVTYGPLCPTWYFTTGSGPWTGMATLTYPANGATGIYTNPTLTWTGPSGANYYKIYVNPGSGAITYYSSTPFLTVSLSASTTYWWQVASSPDSGASYGPLCPTWSFTTASTAVDSDNDGVPDSQDLNPLVDLTLTVQIWEARAIDNVDPNTGILHDIHDPADFYFAITVGSLPRVVYPSDTTAYVANNDHVGGIQHIGNLVVSSPICEFKFNVPDTKSTPTVKVTIELWDDDGTGTKNDDLCDISMQQSYVNSQKNMAGRMAVMTYDLTTGDWTGDDGSSVDSNGIGHVSGTEDGSTAAVDQDDCELWFWMCQNDNDLDGITYQEEIARGSNPICGDSGDYDGDGLDNYGEYSAHTKVDVRDSDNDGLLDGFEVAVAGHGSGDILQPTLQSDAVPFVADLSHNISAMRDAVETYSYHLSYSTLASWFPVTDIGWKDMLQKYAYDIPQDLKNMRNYFRWFSYVGGDPLDLILDLSGEMAIMYLTEVFSWFNDWTLLWMSYTSTNTYSYLDPAGLVYQVGWGTSWQETLHDSLSGLYFALINLGNKLSTGPAQFESARQLAATALTYFGQIHSVGAGSADMSLYVKTSSSSAPSCRPVISASDPTLSTYSDLELMLFNFGHRLDSYVGSTAQVTLIGSDRVTSGMIAQDLVNFAFNTFFVLKEFRLYLTAFVNPA